MLTVTQHEGPPELIWRQRVLVWDDEAESTHKIFKVEDGVHRESEDHED